MFVFPERNLFTKRNVYETSSKIMHAWNMSKLDRFLHFVICNFKNEKHMQNSDNHYCMIPSIQISESQYQGL